MPQPIRRKARRPKCQGSAAPRTPENSCPSRAALTWVIGLPPCSPSADLFGARQAGQMPPAQGREIPGLNPSQLFVNGAVVQQFLNASQTHVPGRREVVIREAVLYV